MQYFVSSSIRTKIVVNVKHIAIVALLVGSKETGGLMKLDMIPAGGIRAGV